MRARRAVGCAGTALWAVGAALPWWEGLLRRERSLLRRFRRLQAILDSTCLHGSRPLASPSPHLHSSFTPTCCRRPALGAALVRDLRELPSKAALQLRSDAANTAAVASNQSAAVQKFVKRIAKQYGI